MKWSREVKVIRNFPFADALARRVNRVDLVFSSISQWKMAIFFNKDVSELLENRKVIVIGDSIQRSVYKDLVCLWTQEDSRYLYQRELRAKGEFSFLGDKLLSGGKLEGKMVNGVGYREVREFSDGRVFFKYYFVTRSYSEHMASILNELKTCQPDVIVMNSTFWDLHHYGDNNLQQYKENLDRLLKDITDMFSSSLLFIWNAALPLAERCKGGFLRKGFLTIPVEKIKAANKFAWLATTGQKKIYLDLFTELKNKENFKQAEDGIHWGMRAHRKISNLILTELCTSWSRKLPDPPAIPNQGGYYPDNGDDDNWNSAPPASYDDGEEMEYMNYVPYWSPFYDRYQTPSPVLYQAPSPYGSSFGSFGSLGLGYNVPFVSQRAREFQPIPTPVPYPFQMRYPQIQEMQFNFGTPPPQYYQGNYFFKPATYSDPPTRRYSPYVTNQFGSLPFKGQGLLQNPLGPQSFGFFNEGSSSYRDRFKKLSNPSVKWRRYKASASTSGATSLKTTQNTRQSQTPQNSLITNEADSTPVVNSSELSDLNNNEEQKNSHVESCSKVSNDNVVTETGVPREQIKPKSPINSTTPVGSSDSVPAANGEDASDGNDGAKICGIKRKREDDEGANLEESNPSKIAREESTLSDASTCGVKRKLEDSLPVEEPSVVKDLQENGLTHDDGERSGLKRRRADTDDVLETPKPSNIQQAEQFSLDDLKNTCGEKQFAVEPNLPEVTQQKGTSHDVVRCSLTYDSFI